MLGFFVSITLQPGANVPDMKEKLALTGADVYYRTSKEMRSTINARFSTAEETAKVLGVSDSRAEKLVSLTRPSSERKGSPSWKVAKKSESDHWYSQNRCLVARSSKAARPSVNTRPKKRRGAKKASSIKRRARGKPAKGSR